MNLFNSRVLAGLLVMAAIAVMFAFPAAASGQEGTPVYGTATRQIDKKEVIRGLPDNDVDRLSKEKGGLRLAEVSFKVTAYDEDGLPSEYEAHVVYRGAETYQVLLYYEPAGTSGGPVSANGQGGDITAVPVIITHDDFADEEGDESEDSALVSAGEPGTEEKNQYINESRVLSPAGVEGENTEDSDSAPAAVAGFSFPANFPASISPVGAASLITLASGAVIILMIVIQGKRRPRPDY